jgi:hypothetical protein
METVELYTYWKDENCPECMMAKSAMGMINSAIPMLQSCFAAEAMPDHMKQDDTETRAMDTENTEAVQPEDLCDKCEKQPCECEGEKEEVEEACKPKRSEEVKVDVEEITRSVKEAFESQITELKSLVESISNEKIEMAERIAKLEKTPVSAPGLQNLTYQQQKSDIEVQIERAKASGNKDLELKLRLLRAWKATAQ